ncbi:hypothetical protein PG993_012330 [Apiospora rasikravindrae]|uniref:Uncharacterized protein n=1 Tax=Apiospora rasikravindrae TaxID=990691 RepID=A0ABR1S258_9PEZI
MDLLKRQDCKTMVFGYDQVKAVGERWKSNQLTSSVGKINVARKQLSIALNSFLSFSVCPRSTPGINQLSLSTLPDLASIELVMVLERTSGISKAQKKADNDEEGKLGEDIWAALEPKAELT